MEKHRDAIEWSRTFIEEFKGESDRAAVILSGAMLDKTLETLLKNRLIAVSGSNEKLFKEGYGPMSSFGAKIDLAYQMGLISAKLCHDLHLIRGIRNAFAHDIEGCNFQNQKVRKHVTELKQACAGLWSVTWRDENIPSGMRSDFESVVACMLYHLFRCTQEVKRIKTCGDEWVYTLH